MRRAWLSAIAGLCVGAMVAAPVAASPAGMSLEQSPLRVAAADRPGKRTSTRSSTSSRTTTSDRSWAESLMFWRDDDRPSKPATPPVAQKASAMPSKEISPWRNPVKYLSATVAETPVAKALAGDDSPKLPQPKDRIALDTPVGPPTPELMISLAQLAERQGNIAEARAQFQQALSKWPKDVEVLRAAARMEDRLGRLDVAEGLYQRAVAADPQHAGAHNDLGLCLARQGKFSASIHEIEQAIHLQPDKALYRNNAATVLVEMKQDQRALAHLSAVHGPAVASYNLGQLLVQRGRLYDAAEHFHAALAMDPTMEPARVALAQIISSAVKPTAQSPAVVPSSSPVEAEPQLTFPATASGPRYDMSSSVPPTAYPSTSVAPQVPAYRTATAPRYLPPVPGAVPGAVVR